MFLHLKNSIPRKIEKLGIKKQLNIVNTCRKAEFLLNRFLSSKKTYNIPKNSIKVVKFVNGCVFVKVDSVYLINELKLNENSIVSEFKKNGILVNKLKYTT